MKKILLIALVLLVTVGCADKLITEEIAIQKAYSYVQQDCLKSPDYSWHSLPISAYSARYDNDHNDWLVDVGPNPIFIQVWDRGDGTIDTIWNLDYIGVFANDKSPRTEIFKREYLKHCNNVYPKVWIY